jgi:hypothetical protein
MKLLTVLFSPHSRYYRRLKSKCYQHSALRQPQSTKFYAQTQLPTINEGQRGTQSGNERIWKVCRLIYLSTLLFVG